MTKKHEISKTSIIIGIAAVGIAIFAIIITINIFAPKSQARTHRLVQEKVAVQKLNKAHKTALKNSYKEHLVMNNSKSDQKVSGSGFKHAKENFVAKDSKKFQKHGKDHFAVQVKDAQTVFSVWDKAVTGVVPFRSPHKVHQFKDKVAFNLKKEAA